MAGTGRDSKEGKDGKEKKSGRAESGDGDSRALLRRLADELSALRKDVDALKSAPLSSSADTESLASVKGKGKKSASNTRTAVAAVADNASWQSADDAEVARIGYAFSSIPKVALVRALLQEGPLPAAKLGEMTHLTTGSLYHHLRELTHADVLVSEGRNRFALTERGRQSALLLFVQAAHS